MDQKDSSRRGMQLHVSAASCSDRGRVRKHNEDAIALCEPPDQMKLSQLGRLYLLADGAGGHAAGEVASQVAVETIAATYYDHMTSTHSAESMLQTQGEVSPPQVLPSDLALPARKIQQAFFAAHARIRDLAADHREYSGMATTCVAAIVKDTQLLVAHLGDSRAYLIRPSPASLPTITRLTTDHSMVTALVQAGVLTPEQMQTSPSRHIILRGLGGNNQDDPDPDITTCMLQAGDYLILCCDGLWSLLSEDEVATVVSNNSPQGACQELVRLANEAGGEDNISVIVLSFGQDQDAQKMGKWQRLLQKIHL
jgi:serine/threonine protein phosphatase PrpC